MDVATAKSIIDDLAENRITALINFYLMGESLLHPEVFTIFEYAFQRGMSVKLNTNASRIDSKTAARLLSYPRLHLFISYHTPDSESFDYYRAARGITYEQWISNIENLIRTKYETAGAPLPAQITMLLLKTPELFASEIRGDVKLVSSNKEAMEVIARWKNFSKGLIAAETPESGTSASRPEGSPKSLLRRLLVYVDRLNYTETLLPGFHITVIKIHSWSNSAREGRNSTFRPAVMGSCDALRETVSILWNGDYTLCCADFDGELVQGNVADVKLSEFLASERARKIIRSFEKNRLPFAKCRRCRGAGSNYNWLFNQVHSAVFYNFGMYRRLRNMLNLDKK